MEFREVLLNKVIEIEKNKKDLRRQMVTHIYLNCKFIKEAKKILIISPHPDDESIGMGGFISAYHDKIDVLCINSSGVKYSFNTEEADEIARQRCHEFYSTMHLAGVQKSWIAEIFGIPPMFSQIVKHFDDYILHFDFKSYDIIFVPQQFDEHREHRFVGNFFVKEILKFTGYKPNLIIMRYEVWGTIINPNFYFDITNFVSLKKKLIQNYVSRSKANYAEKILALNKYRSCIPFFGQNDRYAEAFNKQTISEYLNEKDDLTWSYYA